MAKKTRKGCPIFLLHLLSFLFSVLPLGLVFAFNFGKYTETVVDAVKLSFGGVLLVVFMVLKVLGKLKMPRRVVFYAFVFVGAVLFAAVLEDLVLLSGAALLGEAVDYIFLQPVIARRKSEKEREKVADATADRVEQLFDKYIGGRV
jgi:hypothetical protein